MAVTQSNGVPTIKEVAAHCGVSKATVSRVLNGNFKHGFSVRREVHQRIVDVADSLGYRPNLAAKNLVQRQTKVIAILGCDIALGWPVNIYQAVIDACVGVLHIGGYNICLTVPNLEENRCELPPWKVDGVIVLQECSPETVEEMERANLPYVVINGVGGPNCSSVIPDDIEATKLAIRHLLELGHTRIAYAGPTREHKKHRSIGDRHDTYLSELSKHGLEPVRNHDKVFSSASAFLASSVMKYRATAILAYDHIEAMRILHGAHMLEIQIPRQVSLICFNDEYLCNIVTPPLTTVAVPSKQMGRLAAKMLLERLQSPADYRPKCVKLSQ
ncbi:MAG: LacI family transcriptional regulator, partial [Sedimentisphaerales bacterium]|nr:LacI family transcriptional regulator [Sedimentisphaerales bacterium]